MSAAVRACGARTRAPRGRRAAPPGLGGRERPAGDRDLADLLRAQVLAGELRHFAGAQDQHVQAREVAEDLAAERDRRVTDRDGPFAQPGLGPHALADGEGGVEQPGRDRARVLQSARGRERLLHLPENLRLADHERVEPGGHPEQMAGGLGALQHEDVGRELRPAEPVILRDEPRARVAGRFGVGGSVDLGPVARRDDDRFARHVSRCQRGKGAIEPRARKVDALAQLDGRAPMADADGHEPHVRSYGSASGNTRRERSSAGR